MKPIIFTYLLPTEPYALLHLRSDVLVHLSRGKRLLDAAGRISTTRQINPANETHGTIGTLGKHESEWGLHLPSPYPLCCMQSYWLASTDEDIFAGDFIICWSLPAVDDLSLDDMQPNPL